MPGPWSHLYLAKKKLAPCRNISSGFSCSDLMPIGMKWVCICAGRGDVVDSRCSVSLKPSCRICWCMCCGLPCCRGGSTIDLLERMSSLSSSSSVLSSFAPSSSWLWTFIVCALDVRVLLLRPLLSCWWGSRAVLLV